MNNFFSEKDLLADKGRQINTKNFIEAGRKIINDLKGTRYCCALKEEAENRFKWRAKFSVQVLRRVVRKFFLLLIFFGR